MQSTLKNRTIFCKDNLEVLMGINTASIDLIYLDPPFNKNKRFTAPIGSQAKGASFSDIFRKEDIKNEWIYELREENKVLANYLDSTKGIGYRYNKYYLVYMARRLIEMHRILKPTGSIYLHCDPTMSHYLKLLMDCIFGEKNFRNEIVWCYHGPGSPLMRQFNRKSDAIFWYSKGSKWVFNKDSIRHPYKDDKPHTGGYGIDSAMADEYGSKGKVPENWWVIRVAARSKKEYVGYPTQKPLALLERIIQASSNEGDLVLDPFCGCATTCIAAERHGRQWVGIDISPNAYAIVRERLNKEVALKGEIFKKKVIYRADKAAVLERTDLEIVKMSKREIRSIRYGEQQGYCNGCGEHFEYIHLEIDHEIPLSKGGGNNMDNLQLMCGYCNRLKGDEDMSYLWAELKKRGRLRRRPRRRPRKNKK